MPAPLRKDRLENFWPSTVLLRAHSSHLLHSLGQSSGDRQHSLTKCPALTTLGALPFVRIRPSSKGLRRLSSSRFIAPQWAGLRSSVDSLMGRAYGTNAMPLRVFNIATASRSLEPVA